VLYYLVEDKMKRYVWHQSIIQSLREEMRRKHMTIQEILDLQEIPAGDEEACVLIIGVSERWENRMIEEARKRGILVIINRKSEEPFVSSITSDGSDSLRLMLQYLHSLGKTRLALYSVNPASTADPHTALLFSRMTGREDAVYINNGSLQELFERIEPHLDEYDGIICTNGYAAVSLICHMKKKGISPVSKTYVVSLGDINLLKMVSPSVTAAGHRNGSYGRGAYSAYRLLTQEKGEITSVNICMKSTLNIRESTESLPFPAEPAGEPDYEYPQVQNSFFNDEEIGDIAKLENLLSEGTDVDREIIECLLKGMSNHEIAEKCFLSDTAVKYHIKEMREICDRPDREALVDFLSQYIAPEEQALI